MYLLAIGVGAVSSADLLRVGIRALCSDFLHIRLGLGAWFDGLSGFVGRTASSGRDFLYVRAVGRGLEFFQVQGGVDFFGGALFARELICVAWTHDVLRGFGVSRVFGYVDAVRRSASDDV